MRFWKKRLQRVAAMVCSVALVASMMPTAAFATEPEPTPTPEPTSIVEPTPEPSGSPENTDATGTTSAPGTDADSTSAPSEEPTETPDGSPAPSEKPVESPEPSEVPAEQEQPAPQMLAAAPAPVANEPETRSGPAATDSEKGNEYITVYYNDYITVADAKTLTVKVQNENGEPLCGDLVIDDITTSTTARVTLDQSKYADYKIQSYELSGGGSITDIPGSLNNDQNKTFMLHMITDNSVLVVTLQKIQSRVIDLTDSKAGGRSFGSIIYKEDENVSQTTNVHIYLNNEFVKTVEDLKLPSEIAGLGDEKNDDSFVLTLNDGYYFAPYDVDGTVEVCTASTVSSEQHITWCKDTRNGLYSYLNYSLPNANGTNDITLNFFTYEEGVRADFTRYVNGDTVYASGGGVSAACEDLNIRFTYNGIDYTVVYDTWGQAQTIFLPRDTYVYVEPVIKDGFSFVYWLSDDSWTKGNSLYSVLPDGSLKQEETGLGDEQKGLVALTQTMALYYDADGYTRAQIGLHMTDGDAPLLYNEVYYNSNYPVETGKENETETAYYYPTLDYGTRIEKCMFSVEGYTFAGWNTQEDGNGTPYTAGQYFHDKRGNDLTLYAQWEKIETPPEDDKPDAPDGETLRHLGLGVRVQCITKPDEHGNVVSTIGNTSVKFGDVVEKDGHYECVATISATKYINDFNNNSIYGEPGHVGTVAEVQVVLTSDGKDDPWKLAENQSQITDLEEPMPINITKVVTFEVTCKEETTEIPDVDVTKLGAIIAVDCTTAAEDHPTWMSTILGTFGEDYTIEYSSDKATATITIKNIDDYVSAYGHYVDEIYGAGSYHALDKTKASDLSFKLKYENDAWVLDSDDNTATIYVSCPDVTVEKTITSVERDGKTLEPTPEMLKVGDKINYQIVITNNSNITLNDLTVTDTFTGANAPDAVSGSTKTWDKTADGWTWSDTLTLNVNGKKTFTYTYTVAEGDKGNTIRNSAAVAGKGLDDDEEIDDETTPEVENPAVGVEKSLVQVKRGEEIFLAYKGTIPEELEVGDELTYEIEVKNIGNVKLNGLTLTDTFNGHFAPSKVKDKVANVELTNEWEKDTTTGLWTLKIENISPDMGEIETYTYTYIVNQADAGNNLTNTAAVTGDELVPDDSKDEDKHPVKDDGDITLQPADITIYKGGESGSTSVVEDENGTIAKENNSLPTPGFYFDLPDAVNDAVSTYYGVPSAEAVDLSRFITITAKAEDGSDRVWRLEKYGEGETSFTTIDGQEHYIYKLVAGDGQDPVRVQFTDDQGNFVTSDDFTLEDAMCETYTMQIYTGSVDTSTLTIKVEIPEKDDVPAQTFHCGYGATQTATLTVRYVNGEQEEVVTDAVTAITDVAQENTPLENAYVVADSDAVFNVNDSSVSVNQNSVSLLFDDLTTGETETNKAVERLLAIAEDKSGLTGTIEQQAKYLNLVDADNGNAWLTAEEDVTIYWPYPEGTDKNTKFSLLHFDGIDREMAIGNLVSEVEGVTPEPMMITKDDYGISFTTKTFSPFVLMWETEQPSGGEDKPSGGDNGNNDNNNNNTNTNNQTTTVNVANQAAAPAAAPAAVSVPQTSDDMPIGALTAAAVAAAAALVGLLVVRKRRQK